MFGSRGFSKRLITALSVLALLAACSDSTAGSGDEHVKTDQANFSAGDDVAKFAGEENFTQTATGVEGTVVTTYASSDESVATVVSETGEVYIQAVGTTTITATNAGDDDYNPATDSYLLTVSNPTEQSAFSAGDDVTKWVTDVNFTQSATGAEGTGTTAYASSDTSIATVDAATGEVTLLAVGTTTITAANAGDVGHNPASDSYLLTVNKVEQASFTIDDDRIAHVDDIFTVAAAGADGSGATTYSSSDTNVATVNETTGEVTIVGEGSAVITATNAGDDSYTEATASYSVVAFPAEFITTWQTITVNIPINSSYDTYDYTVDWGDGTVETGLTSQASHTYSDEGPHTVKISGTFPAIAFRGGSYRSNLYTIENWGSIAWQSMSQAFEGCGNLTLNAQDTPDLSAVTHMYNMFKDAEVFNGAIGNWDVSSVTDMQGIFRDAVVFNQDIGSWDVSSVDDMHSMFYGASAFNQDLSEWDTSSLTDANQMFRSSGFNSDISTWDVSILWNMIFMFAEMDFNGDISAWDVSGAAKMGNVFYDNPSFNQDISAWDVSNVETMSFMFYNATNFDQDISAWDVSSVIDMGYLFFGASSLDQDLGDWNVISATDMGSMFRDASSFNQDLSGWDVDYTDDDRTSAVSHTNFSSGWGGGVEPNWVP